MATTYRLIGTGVDVFMDTDATRGAREFFITDIRGLDSSDIMNGFDVGIEQYSEGQLMAFAMEQGIELFSFDARRKDRCLVRQMAPGGAGSFNGVSSSLLMPAVALANSGTYILPVIIELTFRLSAEDLMAITGNSFTLFSTVSTANNFIFINGAISNTDTLSFIVLGTIGSNSTPIFTDALVNITDRCLTMRFELEDIGPSLQLNFAVNDEIMSTRTYSKPIVTGNDDFVFTFGSGNGLSGFFRGIIRNIVVSAGGTELINVVNPSTGTNTGTGGDGTATDIESVDVMI